MACSRKSKILRLIAKAESVRQDMMVLVALLLFGAVILAVIVPASVEDSLEFKVVARYKDCDVVRYLEEGGAKYHYLLHCPSNNPDRPELAQSIRPKL